MKQEEEAKRKGRSMEVRKEKENSGGMDVESPQSGLKKASVGDGPFAPLRLLPAEAGKCRAWATATVYGSLEESLPRFLFDILSKGKKEYFNAMEHKVVPAYVMGHLAPTLEKSRESREQLTRIAGTVPSDLFQC